MAEWLHLSWVEWASEPLFGWRMVGGFRSVSGFSDSLVH